MHLLFNHGFERYFCEMLHREEPLHGQTGLDGRIHVAFRIAHLVDIVFYAFHQAGFLQVLDYLFAAGHTVHTYINRALVRDCRIFIEDVDSLQLMGFAEHVVVHVVRGGHLQTACSELDVDVAVFDNTDHAANKGHDYLAALEPLVLRVLRVDAHRRITHDGLGTCGSHNGIIAFGVLVYNVAFGFQGLFVLERLQAVDIIFQMEQMALLFLVDYFLG